MILNSPDLRVVRKGDPDYTEAGYFRLSDPMYHLWPEKKCVVKVEEGTLTNFASIPRALRGLINVNGNHRLAAVSHDDLYQKAGCLMPYAMVDDDGRINKAKDLKPIAYTRQEADRHFWLLVILEGDAAFTADIMYRGVRCFGWAYYNKMKQKCGI